jgi:hypothetical protein
MKKTNAATTIKINAGPFETRELAVENKPDNPMYSLFGVTSPTGENFFAWARNTSGAVAVCAKAQGWKANVAKTVSKEKVSELLASLSEADRKELIKSLSKK